MRPYLAIALMLLCTLASAQSPVSKNSPDVEMAAARKLSSEQIFKEIKRQGDIMATKKNTGDSLWSMIADSENTAAAYQTVLKQRWEAGDGQAALYYGWSNGSMCEGLLKVPGIAASFLQTCWDDSLNSLKFASASGIAPASGSVAIMYLNGYGVARSKLVASEWYVKSAEQYHKGGFRDSALTAVEAALEATPDHPAALRLRKAWLK